MFLQLAVRVLPETLMELSLQEATKLEARTPEAPRLNAKAETSSFIVQVVRGIAFIKVRAVDQTQIWLAGGTLQPLRTRRAEKGRGRPGNPALRSSLAHVSVNADTIQAPEARVGLQYCAGKSTPWILNVSLEISCRRAPGAQTRFRFPG